MKQKINRRIIGGFPRVWKLSNILLNNSWVRGEITIDIRKYFELNDNESKHVETREKQLKKCVSGNVLF